MVIQKSLFLIQKPTQKSVKDNKTELNVGYGPFKAMYVNPFWADLDFHLTLYECLKGNMSSFVSSQLRWALCWPVDALHHATATQRNYREWGYTAVTRTCATVPSHGTHLYYRHFARWCFLSQSCGYSCEVKRSHLNFFFRREQHSYRHALPLVESSGGLTLASVILKTDCWHAKSQISYSG